MIEATSHHLRLPMGVLALRIPAIRLHGIAVQPAIHIMEIIGGKPLQHLPLALIPAQALRRHGGAGVSQPRPYG